MSELLRIMWISDLEAESKVLCWPKSSFSFPLNKIFGQPSISVPPEKLSKSLIGTGWNPSCGRSGDDLNLAVSVKGEREKLELMSSLMIEFGRDGEGRGCYFLAGSLKDLHMI